MALGLLALASMPLDVRAQERSTDIVVREGDTCEAIAERLYGDDADALEVLHAHNPDLGPLPHHLAPGTVLHAPPAARLTTVERSVARREPDAAEFRAAAAGDALPRGTQVRTDDRASAEITFRDRAVVSVRERTLVVVYGGRRRLVERSIGRAELERGALRSRLTELAGGPSLEVETPSAAATLGGDGIVSVEEDGTSRLVNHGRRGATVVAGGERVTVPPDTGVVVHRGESPSRPRRLLAAPRWRSDARGFVLGFAQRGATVRGGFEPVAGAASYRVELARAPDGSDLVAAVELDASATEFAAPGLPSGTIYVSVASIDEAGLEGRRSPWRAFSIRLARLVSPGGVDATLEGEQAPRVLPGTWLVAPRGLVCGTADETASEIVTLRGAGPVTVTCSDGAAALEPATLEVVVAPPHIVVSGTLTRDRRTSLRLTLSGDPLPPTTALALTVPVGFEAGRIRPTGSGAEEAVVDVFTPAGAEERAQVTVVLFAGTERVSLAERDLPVLDVAGSRSGVTPPTTPPPAAPEARTVQGAFGDLGWPSMLALRDERRRGFVAWLSGATIASESGDPQVRLGGGARVQAGTTPLRFALATAGDPLGAAQPIDRRFTLDLLASIGALLFDHASWSAAIDLSAFLPTRREPESLGRARLAPSLELSLRPTEWLALRTRQGALIDATSDGARLWAFALGADLTLVRWLALGIELDGSVGRFSAATGAALGLALGAELRLDGFEVALGARIGLTDEARALAGEWATTLSVRLFVP